MPLTLNLRTLLVCTGTALLALAASSRPLADQSAAAAKPAIGAWGVDLTAMDNTVNPGDDFFRYVSGAWMRRTQIPADRTRWGPFNMLAVKSEDDVKAAIEEAAKSSPAAGSVERKAIDYYEAYIDTARIDALGLAPVKPDLDRIAAVQTHEGVVAI